MKIFQIILLTTIQNLRTKIDYGEIVVKKQC